MSEEIGKVNQPKVTNLRPSETAAKESANFSSYNDRVEMYFQRQQKAMRAKQNNMKERITKDVRYQE
jgi:hypothetical protein